MKKKLTYLLIVLTVLVFGGLSRPLLSMAEDDPAVLAEIAGMPDDESTAKWLAKNPKAADAAFANAEWLDAHPRVVDSMLQNRSWLERHPNTAKVFYGNRKYLNSHPEVAKKAYEENKTLKTGKENRTGVV